MSTYIVPNASQEPQVQLRELTTGGELVSISNPLPVSASVAINSEFSPGTTAPPKTSLVGGKSNDGTPQYQPLPLGASGRSIIIEGFTGGTGVPVTGTFWQATQPVSLASLPALAAGSALIGGAYLVDSGGTNKAAVDASGRLSILAINNALPAGTNILGGMYLYDSAGTNKLAIDSSGRLTLIPNSSVNHAQVNGNAVSTDSGTSGSGTQRIINAGAGTGTKSSVASSASSVTILAANTSRKGAIIYNDSTQVLYLDLSGGAASTSSYSVQVPSQGFFELPGPTIYNGAITGIWASANGNARVTEFS